MLFNFLPDYFTALTLHQSSLFSYSSARNKKNIYINFVAMLVNVVTMLVNVDTMLVNVVTVFVRKFQNNDRTLSIKICIAKMYIFVTHSATFSQFLTFVLLACEEKVIFINVVTTQ